MKTIIITQARTGSSRLPGKVLLTAGGKTFLQIHVERLKKVTAADGVIVATSTNSNDARIVAEALRLNITCSKGSEQDVLSRYYEAAKNAHAGIVVRVTSDCPFADPEVIGSMINFFKANKYDYVSNTFKYTYPDGIDVEVMSFTALEKAFKEATLKSDREHVTPYIRKNADLENGSLFKAFNFTNPVPLTGTSRLTLDEPADLIVLRTLIETLGTDKPWISYHQYLVDNPELNQLNNHIPMNEGYDKSLQQDETNH